MKLYSILLHNQYQTIQKTELFIELQKEAHIVYLFIEQNEVLFLDNYLNKGNESVFLRLFSYLLKVENFEILPLSKTIQSDQMLSYVIGLTESNDKYENASLSHLNYSDISTNTPKFPLFNYNEIKNTFNLATEKSLNSITSHTKIIPSEELDEILLFNSIQFIDLYQRNENLTKPFLFFKGSNFYQMNTQLYKYIQSFNTWKIWEEEYNVSSVRLFLYLTNMTMKSCIEFIEHPTYFELAIHGKDNIDAYQNVQDIQGLIIKALTKFNQLDNQYLILQNSISYNRVFYIQLPKNSNIIHIYLLAISELYYVEQIEFNFLLSNSYETLFNKIIQ